jgi:hypothetical protein
MSEEKLPPKPPRDPQPLSSEYHKARKQVLLWAGILFVWELVGIDLEKAKDAGGNVGALIGSLKSPQAVPWTLLVLVGYFLFKLWVEWTQCGSERRNVRAARVDYRSAWIISFAAVALYVGQTLGRVQLADRLQNQKGRSMLVGLVAGCCTSLAVAQLRKSHWRSVGSWLFLLILPALLPWLRGEVNWAFLLIGVIGGVLLETGLLLFAGRRSGRARGQSSI